MGVIINFRHLGSLSAAPHIALLPLESFTPHSTSVSEHGSIVLAQNAGPTTTPVTFEPILSVPALVSFVFVSTILSALILRTNQVEQAVQNRNTMLYKVRDLKSKKLAGDASISKLDVDSVLVQYEQAVRTEEALRTLVPGIVRIVPPSDANQKDEARAVAKQLLGKEYDIGVQQREQDRYGQLPGVAIGVLVVIALLLVGQLGFMSWMFVNDPVSPGSRM
jgi:nitrate reductase NapE component